MSHLNFLCFFLENDRFARGQFGSAFFLITRFKWDENPSVLISDVRATDKHALKLEAQKKKKLAQGQGNSRSEEKERKNKGLEVTLVVAM